VECYKEVADVAQITWSLMSKEEKEKTPLEPPWMKEARTVYPGSIGDISKTKDGEPSKNMRHRSDTGGKQKKRRDQRPSFGRGQGIQPQRQDRAPSTSSRDSGSRVSGSNRIEVPKGQGDTSQTDPRSRLCFNCGKPGHKARHCRKPSGAISNVTVGAPKSPWIRDAESGED